MVRNNFEIDFKVKCIEQNATQTALAEKIGTTQQYISRVVNDKNVVMVNQTYVKLMEALGYDIELTYIPREK